MKSESFGTSGQSYWDEYSNLQRVKHDLIRRYLGGWFPKLGFTHPRILYVDSHAGRGRHLSGELGSPLVALKVLLEHRSRERILKDCEVQFIFLERDEENGRLLEEEIQEFQPLPRNIIVEVKSGDYSDKLTELIAEVRTMGLQLGPAFMFIDPFGFKISGELLKELMSFSSIELFVNVMWRELDMAVAQGAGSSLSNTLDYVFSGTQWRTRITSSDVDMRAEQAISLLRENIGAQWPTYVRMLGDNELTRYMLLHLSNSDDGRDLMKDCVWKICPDGGFYARKSDDPGEEQFITMEPDLEPLRKRVVNNLIHNSAGVRWSKLHDEIRETIWLGMHLNQVVRGLKKSGKIEGKDYVGRFSKKADPLLVIVDQEISGTTR